MFGAFLKRRMLRNKLSRSVLAHTLAQPNKNSLSEVPFEALNQGSCWRTMGANRLSACVQKVKTSLIN